LFTVPAQGPFVAIALLHLGVIMHTKQNSLSRAVRLALSIGLVSSVTVVHAQDANQDNKPPPPKETKTLQAIEVTGSLIRRVDSETASPVVTLNRER
jgi:hypothetical protein